MQTPARRCPGELRSSYVTAAAGSNADQRRSRRADDLAREPPGGIGHLDGAAREHRVQVVAELALRTRQATRWDPERRLDTAGLHAVPVGLLGRHRSHEEAVRQQERLDQGGVDPGEQVRIVSAVGGTPVGPVEATVDAVVDGIDPRGRGRGLRLRAERQREHGGQRPVQPPEPPPAVGGEPAVLGHSARHLRVGDLQQDSPAPAGQEHPFPVDPPGDAPRGDRLCSKHPVHASIMPRPGNFGRPPPVVWASPLTLERRTPCVESPPC